MYETSLMNAGLTKVEAKAYAALAERGTLSVADLGRHGSLHRPAAYKALSSLILKGLVKTVVAGKRKAYAAESPEKLERLMDESHARAKEALRELAVSSKYAGSRPKVTYGEGKKAIRDAFSDVVHSLKRGDTYFRYSSGAMLDRKQETYVPKDYREVRDRKGLERYVITNVPTQKVHAKRLGREVKAVPPDFDLFEYNVTQIVYGDKVAIIDYNTETAITVENPVIAEFQKKIFKLLFKKL
jgi:sugar-specific transcriptional regulator TrmB